MSSPAPTRRRVIVTDVGQVSTAVEPVPEPAPDEALVTMVIAGVCGSDLHALAGKHPLMVPPFHPGHEVVGIVQEVGADVTDITPGQRVIPEPTLPCGHCKMCRTGRSNICENLQFFGCGFREGGMADSFTIRADRLHVVPEEFSDEQAVLIEPLATPVHAVRNAGGVEGKAVVITGCGTIGLLVLAAARAGGARRIVMTDPLEAKRDVALRSGADAVIDATTPDLPAAVKAELGETADVVFDCVSIEPTVAAAVDMVERGGTVVMVGVPAGSFPVPAFTLQDKQIRLQGTATYTAEDYRESIRILRDLPDAGATMVTAQYPLDDAAAAFDAARSGAEIKVAIRP